jgi:hypothetical protein
MNSKDVQQRSGGVTGLPWLTPLMVIAGAWAARTSVRDYPDWPLWLALAVLLAAMWGLIWRTVTGVHWASLLAAWRGWSHGTPLPALPYAQPGSDAAYVALRLGQLKSWLSSNVQPYYGEALLLCTLAAMVAAALSAVLGATAVLLSLASLALTQVAVLVCQGNGKPNTWLSGATLVGLPVLLGYVTFQSPVLPAWALSLSSVAIFADSHGQWSRGRDLGLAVAALACAALRWPASAFALAAIWAARFTLKPSGNESIWLTLAVFALATTAG